MKVEVIGTGCTKGHQLEKRGPDVGGVTGIAAEIVTFDDIVAIKDRGITFTPVLAVDGDLKIAGRVPSKREFRDLVTAGGS